ncbi:flagellar basal body P-ring formation chaperone FlgA [Acetobacter oeni]|uniref:SAF domain-containing protein n=1 Tax=Acetobacter oeni TaxID=304077 RepID=A0A511XME0_9PROT|nr:flagellar basal body P-ring formation chaperone FlgA [Acetobacter oeni]MBB3884102.1 flagella basal body P-ring formation protein FlgA [Acetobacter oeni]NHO20106.1 flagellar basal body P-ring formation protein FlgA [Acetobacter oeni]GBR02561.1 flagellar basal body P-ring biosynthesis protein [Acetobacter oeni LMG 21952]GEN64086.1 hypothetical protein AOE01nite_23100 [Acetobacter oeni]
MIRQAHRLLPAIAIGLCLTATVSDAATLRRATVLHRAQVRLSDLFASLDPGQDCDIGAAPEAGQSQIIDGAQLEAIATQFGVDWPDASVTSRTTLTRAARTISRDDITPLITTELKKRGVPDNAAIDIPDFSGPTVADEPSIIPQLANVVYDTSHGRFSAYFTIPADSGTSRSFRADGTVSARINAVTTIHELAAGQTISRDDIDVLSGDSRTLPVKVIGDPNAVVGQTARHDIAAGTPLTSDQIIHIDLVEKGAPVILDVSSTGLHLTASGIAVDSGALGERIHVLNPTSRMIVIGQVVDRSHVEVLPGSTPLPADQRVLRGAGVRSQQNI